MTAASPGSGVSADMIARVLNRIALVHGPATRSEISKGTMLDRPLTLASGTVHKAVDALRDEHLLREDAPREGQPGPKATPLRLSQDWVIAGIHIDQQREGPDKLTGVLCGLDRQQLGRTLHSDVPKENGKHELRGLVRALRELTEALLAQAPVASSGATGPKLFAVGVELGGHVHHGIVIDSTHAGWPPRVPLADALTKALGGVTAIVENDVNALTIHEYLSGTFRGINVALIVVFRQGVGGGLLLDGRMYRGSHGLAPEPGHLTVEYPSDETEERLPARRAGNGLLTFDDECLCGAYGHVDALATPTRIEGQLAALKPDENEKITLQRAAAAPRDLPREGQLVLTEEAVVLRRAGRALGRGLADTINIVNPGQLVLLLPKPLVAAAGTQSSGAEYLAAVEREIDGAYSTGPADARGNSLHLTVRPYADDQEIAHQGAVAAASTAFNAFIEHIRGFDGCHPVSEEERHRRSRRVGSSSQQPADQPA